MQRALGDALAAQKPSGPTRATPTTARSALAGTTHVAAGNVGELQAGRAEIAAARSAIETTRSAGAELALAAFASDRGHPGSAARAAR